MVNNYVPNIPTSRITQIPSIKIDQVIGNKGRLAFFYEQTKTTAPLSFTFGNVDGLPDPLATNLGTFQNAPLYRLNYDYTLRPTVLLHFGAGYRSNYFFVPAVNEEGQVPDFNASAFGFKGGLTNQFFPPISGLCTAGATTGSCAGQGGMQTFGNASYAENITQVPSFNTSVSWVKDNHTYKFGSEFRTEGYPAISKANSSGSYVFAADQTSLPYLNGTTLCGLTPGFGYASFLLGDVKTVSIANPVDPRLGKKQFGIYAQDSWKITRKITFDYGLRYDYSTYLQEQYGRAPFFSPDHAKSGIGGHSGSDGFSTAMGPATAIAISRRIIRLLRPRGWGWRTNFSQRPYCAPASVLSMRARKPTTTRFPESPVPLLRLRRRVLVCPSPPCRRAFRPPTIPRHGPI